MPKAFFLIIATLCLCSFAEAQSTRLWSEKDRQYLLNNLQQSRDELIKETANLTPEQWNFKERPDRWSISQVLEHINIYELLWQRETSMALKTGPITDFPLTARPDSSFVRYISEETPHITTESTKPFTFSVPQGIGSGTTNVAWFTKMRNESINFIKGAQEDFRIYALKAGRPDLHQLYIYVFGHTNRHLRQIRKIKQDPNYPK